MANSFSVIADMLDAAASIATLGVAIFVLVTARSIQKAEGVFRQNQIWNEFGHAVARLQKESRVGDLLMGKKIEWDVEPPAIEDQLNAREAFLLMSFFNVVSNEYNAFMAKTIDDDYFIHSLAMTCRVLESERLWIFRFLEKHGYEASYVAFLHCLVDSGDCDARVALAREKRNERAWRKRLRNKLRTWQTALPGKAGNQAAMGAGAAGGAQA